MRIGLPKEYRNETEIKYLINTFIHNMVPLLVYFYTKNSRVCTIWQWNVRDCVIWLAVRNGRCCLFPCLYYTLYINKPTRKMGELYVLFISFWCHNFVAQTKRTFVICGHGAVQLLYGVTLHWRHMSLMTYEITGWSIFFLKPGKHQNSLLQTLR